MWFKQAVKHEAPILYAVWGNVVNGDKTYTP